jgi:Ni2+-binding GTPase involved in maturation of urease and hydrogenase
MKRAVIVKGNPGIGKSTILLAIYDWIKTTYTPLILHEEIYHKIANDKSSPITDVFGIIQVGNLKIGLCSGGDDGHNVKNFIDESVKANCDIVVCACRRRGGTFNVIRANLTYPNFVTDWCIPESISPSISIRVSVGIEEVKARLIGLPKI